MRQNELQRVVAELDELISRDEEQQDYCSETGPNEAMRRVVALTEIRNIVSRLVAAASRIESAQAVAPGGGGVLPDALVPYAEEWYRLCERRFAVDRITISWQLAEAIVIAVCGIAAAPASEAKGQEPDHEFKNFHRSLCERFGYTHDTVDWKRDQVSLIEHIAKMVKPTAGSAVGESGYASDPTNAEHLSACRKRIKESGAFVAEQEQAGESGPAREMLASTDETEAAQALSLRGRITDSSPVVEQEQAGEFPELPALAGFLGGKVEPNAAGKIRRDVYTADQMHDYANAALLRRGARVEVTDAMVERLAIAMYAARFGFCHEVAVKRWPDVEQKSRFTAPVRAALEPGK